MSLEVRDAGFDDPAVQRLVAELDDDLAERYPDDGIPPPVHLPEHYAPPAGVFLLALLEGEPVGCGGVRSGPEPGVGEVKRMYVVPAARGRGVAKAVLAGLVDRGRALGYRRLVLETGQRQPEAVALYESLGWTPTAPFGHYRESPLSLCYGLDLT